MYGLQQHDNSMHSYHLKLSKHGNSTFCIRESFLIVVITSSISTSLGVPSIKMLIEDFVIPQALFKIITETKILAIGSAIVHPNAQIKIAAVMAPTEPNKSTIG